MKRVFFVICILILILTAGVSSFAADPQYYNYNTAGSANSFPFNISSGKEVQLLYLPGDFNQPTPAPAGNITSISFFISPGYPLGPWTYTDFTIKMGQSSITSFTSGSFYAGPLTTVYYRSSVSLTGTAGQWMTITLDSPFAYDPAQSLIIDVAQSGVPGATGFSASFTRLTDNRRIYSAGGAPFVYGSADPLIYHAGLTISSPNSVTVPAAIGNGDITLETNSAGCGFTSYGVKTEAQVGDDPSYDYPYGLVEFTLNCESADVTITFPGDISGTQYRKYGPVTPGDNNTTAWYDFNGTITGNQIILHLNDNALGDDTGDDGIIVDQGGPGQIPHTVPTMNEWGMIIFIALAGFGSVYYLRRKRIA